MSNIQGDVIELQSLKQEYKKQLGILASYRKNIAAVEYRIQEYLDAKDQPGVKYKGYAVMRNTKPIRKRKKKDEQLSDSISVLERYHISNPEEVLKEILEARRGSPGPSNKLVVKKYKDNSNY